MSAPGLQSHREQTASRRLLDHVTDLGFVLIRIGPDGTAEPASPCPWFERQVIESDELARAIASVRDGLDPEGGALVEPISGLFLAPLDPATVGGEASNDAARFAGMLLTPAFVEGEALRRICDQQQLDWQATRGRVDPERLVGVGEARRLGCVLHWMQQDAAGARVHRQELHHLSQELSHNYEELSLIYTLSHSMALNQPAEAFFRETCADLQEVSSLNWIGLQITDRQPRLTSVAGQHFLAGRPGNPEAARRLGPELLETYHAQRDPVILDEPGARWPELADHDKSLLVVPLHREGQVLGVLYGGGRRDGQHVTSIDAKLCASVSNNLAIFLENFMLFEDAQALFLGTLHALTRAIDAKDSYTFGHSERVAELSRMLARAAGHDDATAERVYLAGLVHDVGKIGVPEAVLCKTGRLSDHEFEAIKAHPAIGADILRDIRQMEDLIPGVLHHHERWDGRGYPDRLQGRDIPLFGRIIGLADAFDAMSSNRTYRSALDHAQVIAEIRAHRGTQFDPDLAEVFLGLDFTPYFDLIRRHRAEKDRGPA